MKRHLPLLLLLVACAPKAPKILAVVDTLPGGVKRVSNPAPSGWTDTNQIVFTEIQRIQPADGEPGELGDIWGMAVDDAGGIWISEPGPTRIDRFSADGQYIGQVGRQGSGPGEYQSTMITWVAGHLFLHDPQTQRTTIFDSAGKYLRSWNSTCCIYRSIGGDSLGRGYVPVMPDGGDMEEQGMGWIRFTVDGVPVDTIWRRPHKVEQHYWEFSPAPGSRSRYGIPFQPSLVDVPWVGGGSLIGDNATYSITIAPKGRDSALVFGRAWTPEPIPVSVRESRLKGYTERNEALRQVAKLEDIPTTAPAFSDLLVDTKDRIWVELTVPRDSVGTYWDIFTSDGVWQGVVHAPFRTGQVAFHGDEMIVSTTDEEDLPVIVRYRMSEGGSGDAPRTAKLGS